MSCILTHSFSKWKEISRSDISKGYPWQDKKDWRHVGVMVIMERDCERCGKKELDTIEHINMP